jgi:hypothetical protein
MKKKHQADNKRKLESGQLMPTLRQIGQRRYIQRLPDFKEIDTDIPTAKNIEGSSEPLRYIQS